MAKKKTDPFTHLSWNDLKRWAGSKIVSRGRSYQRGNLVSELAVIEDGGLIAWVEGTHRYATRVTIKKGSLPESICTCPYSLDCKHGVAVVLEYLEYKKKNIPVPNAGKEDERLFLFKKDKGDNEVNNDDLSSPAVKKQSEILTFLKKKTKAQLMDMILELTGKFPRLAQELTNRQTLASVDAKTLMARLKADIHKISSEPGWQHHWDGELYTPDYSKVRLRLETLLKWGHPDEILELGKELIELGNQQIGMSDDEGETAMEIEGCMPVIVKALEQSSLNKTDKLAWAVDVVLKDDYDTFNAFDEYLCRKHLKTAWNTLADRLLKQLDEMEYSEDLSEFKRNHDRDLFSNWIIHALDQAGRKEEIIPLCEAEARKTGSYSRLVNYLISKKQYTDAEHWIEKGILATEKRWPGIAPDLRKRLKEIRIVQKDWTAVATLRIEEFVRNPSEISFVECQKANNKTGTWPQVRETLLIYLEKGNLPWLQKNWPLGKSDQIRAEASHRKAFPMTTVLIDIAIREKKPDRVLFWYDRHLKDHIRGWSRVDNDRIAKAIQNYAPERAVSIWKKMAETLIAETQPRAYQQAVGHLDKAGKIMKRIKKQDEWNQYLHSLKKQNARKRRLIEILDRSDSKPIISGKG